MGHIRDLLEVGIYGALWEGEGFPSNSKHSGLQLMLTDGSSAPGAAVKKAK